MSQKQLTKLQKQKQLERSRRDLRVRKIKKLRPLCVSREFIDYACRKGWNDATTDAAALVMHRWFMLSRKHNNNYGWVPMPYQVFKGMFGTDYKRIRNHLIEIGFLEYNTQSKYKVGRYCSRYRICNELRNNRISASYRLKSKELQERFIANKEYWKKMSVAERQEQVAMKIKTAFSVTDSANTKTCHRFVVKGYMTEEQFETIQRLVTNAHALELKINDVTITEIANERFGRKEGKEINCDFDAFVQYYLEMAERTLEPTVTIDRWNRFYGPMTGMAREYWDYVFFKQEQLVSVDVKCSHCNCLLALIKDIAINFFGNEGSYSERLLKCQFSRQIQMIPGLVRHLQLSSDIYAAGDYFEYVRDIPCIGIDYRKLMYSLFSKFTRSYLKIVNAVCKCNNVHILSYNNTNSIINFTQFVQSNIYCNTADTNPISDVHSLSNHINHYSHTSLLSSLSDISSLPHHPFISPLSTVNPFLYVFADSVEFRLQTHTYKEVMEILSAYGFRLKSAGELNKPVTVPSDVPLFRNLFFPCPEEIAEFERLLTDDIYRLLMKAIRTDLNRGEFKSKFFHFLYRPAFNRFSKREQEKDGVITGEKIEEPIRKAFATLLPSIVFFFDLCKCRPGTLDQRWDYYKWISRATIAIESQIMLECCANLWNKYPKMIFTTLHDCIKCLPQDVEKVTEELKRTFTKYHVAIKTEVKQHKVQSDL